MKKGLVILFGILLGVGLAQSVFAEDDGPDVKLDLARPGREEVLRGNVGKIDLPPMPLKVEKGPREINVGEAPMVERVVDKKTFAKEVQKAEDKRHFTALQKKVSSPPERLRGPVVRGSSLKREYVPPVIREQGLYSSIYKRQEK